VPIQEFITSLDNAGKYYLTTLFQLEVSSFELAFIHPLADEHTPLACCVTVCLCVCR